MMKLEELMKKFVNEHRAEIEEAVRDALLNGDAGSEKPECEELKAGNRFVYRGIEYICLDVFGKEVYGSEAAFAVTAEIIKTMEFAEKYEDGCNNWKTSKVRDWLNDEFLSMHVSKEDLIPQTSDLTADNGDDAYGTCEDYVTLLSCVQYRKYRKLMPKYDDWVWTVTPWTCHSANASDVRYINPSGGLNNYNATYGIGVAPACLFNLDNLNLRRQAQLVHEDKPENEDMDDCEEE